MTPAGGAPGLVVPQFTNPQMSQINADFFVVVFAAGAE